MQDDCLRRLADHAGLMVTWANFRGDELSVAPDVLRAVLGAMQLAADNERVCAETLAELEAERREREPALLIGRLGDALTLPPSLLDGGIPAKVWLHPERGEPVALPLEDNGRDCRLRMNLDCPGYYLLEVGRHRVRLAVAPRRCLGTAEMTGRARSWGLAAQLYSLPRHGNDQAGQGDGGIGDFTGLAELAGALGSCGADALAISPVHALFGADVSHFSPYSPSSRLFLNALHIDALAAVREAGMTVAEIDPTLTGELAQQEQRSLIDWPAAATLRLRLLRAVWDRVAPQLLDGSSAEARAFEGFRREGGAALAHHALFEALHAHQFGANADRWHWRSWGAEWRDPEGAAARNFAREHGHEIGYHAWLQWLADRGLAGAQHAAEAAGMGIGLVADLAVGTDTGGSHAWSYQQDMLIGLSVGAPPDLLNSRGQNWGLTTFSPRALVHHGFSPFIDMLRACLRHARGLRIDHVLGLRRLWVIPDGGEEGAYLRYPLDDLLKLVALESWRHRAVICGEDLGTVPEGLRESLADEGVLGMRVLWFERDHELFIDPSRWSDQAMAVTTTHDLPTVAGWWSGRDIDWRARLGQLGPDTSEQAERTNRARDRRVLWSAFEHAGVADGTPPASDEPERAVQAAIGFVGRTPAPLTVVPLEDMLGFVEQPNLPGTTDQHPNWRRRLPAPAPMLLQEPATKDRLAALQRARSRS